MPTGNTELVEADLDDLRNGILAEVERVASRADDSKAACRALHNPAIRGEIERQQRWIRGAYPKYGKYFSNGNQVDPSRISPLLVEVTEQWQADLFRLARLTWSLPYSKGYGRRLRFLLLDQSNDKLIGILGLQSPPLDFPARDRLFHYPNGRKVELVNQTMDIYSLGAVPPYGRLLGGKLVALASTSHEVSKSYERKYAGRATEMSKRTLPPGLVALTTTSAFGRSSLYNRITFNGELVAKPIGYTEGYGSFHLAVLYPRIREFLKSQGVSTRGGFGVGPRIIWQTYVRALGRLGLSDELLKHGLRREVYLFPLIQNLTDYMEGRAIEPEPEVRLFCDLVQWWRERWLLPRAERVDGWCGWDSIGIKQMLVLDQGGA
ncbi:MAG: DUF4338 domain-containing protein [Dehalococcoidia bacterium]|nr:DUF4338 domain-containing protein [Dehalococcoidia bacterium]